MLDRLDLDTDKPNEEEVARKFGFEDDYYNGTVSWWQNTKPKLWSLFDEPYSSQAAKASQTAIELVDYTYFRCIFSHCFPMFSLHILQKSQETLETSLQFTNSA